MIQIGTILLSVNLNSFEDVVPIFNFFSMGKAVEKVIAASTISAKI